MVCFRTLETGFHTPPPLEGQIARDTFTPLPSTLVFLGPWDEKCLYTTGAEAEHFAVNFSKKSVQPLYKNQFPPKKLGAIFKGVILSRRLLINVY